MAIEILYSKRLLLNYLPLVIGLLWINRNIKQHIIKLKMRDVKSPMVISFILFITLVPIISCSLLDFNP